MSYYETSKVYFQRHICKENKIFKIQKCQNKKNHAISVIYLLLDQKCVLTLYTFVIKYKNLLFISK